jgi:hypothetical protein
MFQFETSSVSDPPHVLTREATVFQSGAANVNPPQPDLSMTTSNVHAQAGLNPHTAMRPRLPSIAPEYEKQRPATALKIHRPAFYASVKEILRAEQLQMDGLFWVYWLSDGRFPSQYSNLETIVR